MPQAWGVRGQAQADKAGLGCMPSAGDGSGMAELRGYLQKKTKHGRWQRRWFETKGAFLTYYKEEGGQILAAVNLPQVSAVELGSGEAGLFTLKLDDRFYSVRAESSREAKRWVAGLQLRQAGKVATTPTAGAESAAKATTGAGASSERPNTSLVSNAAAVGVQEGTSLSPRGLNADNDWEKNPAAVGCPVPCCRIQ